MKDAVYGMAGAALFAMYLAYHTRTIVSGKYTAVKMNQEDYVLGASMFSDNEVNTNFSHLLSLLFPVSLYNDIINMFLYILRIIGEDRHD